ncbi:MAG TPA: DNA repair protein RecN [Candidatus Onthovicinus excrementipullorum]|nr:DNA repair protein RecN [Candidatus Onthovicinus excrementipullorum]
MLVNLVIDNIAVIEHTDIDFSAGFNVMTGETGAGKSIVIDSINAILGERTSRELIRHGAERASVTAVFDRIPSGVSARLEEYGIEAEESELIISRVISSEGKNKCHINGRPVTVSVLRDIAGDLINIHGQHDSQSLLDSEKHIRFIDAYAQNSDILDQYRAAYRNYCTIRRELSRLKMDEQEKQRRTELLEYQIKELEEAGIVPGERDRLEERRKLAQNAQKVTEAARQAYAALSGDGEEGFGARDLLLRAAQALTGAAPYYQAYNALAQKLEELSYLLEEYAGEIHSGLENADSGADELEGIEARLDELYRLSLKYGDTEEEMLAHLERSRAELENIVSSDERAQELASLLVGAREQVLAAAVQLTQSRTAAADQLSEQVQESLTQLDMPNTRFVVHRTETPAGSNGAETMEFYISANPGEPPRPLSKIASGGELSRIMLALKNVLSAQDDVPTLIFDEIDTGVSGRAAQKIGRMMRRVARGHQVICVTHLAPIAAMGDAHLLIEKRSDGQRTYTKVIPLDFEGRKHELARITGGDQITRLQLDNAEEMIKSAQAIDKQDF